MLKQLSQSIKRLSNSIQCIMAELTLKRPLDAADATTSADEGAEKKAKLDGDVAPKRNLPKNHKYATGVARMNLAHSHHFKGRLACEEKLKVAVFALVFSG